MLLLNKDREIEEQEEKHQVEIKDNVDCLATSSHGLSYRPILVCSALSSHSKTEGTTSQLLGLAHQVTQCTSFVDLQPGLDQLQQYHEDMLHGLFHSNLVEASGGFSASFPVFHEALILECQQLRSYLQAVHVRQIKKKKEGFEIDPPFFLFSSSSSSSSSR
ncbi:hypothetical protein HMI55_002036 [Coelomomyces lativittatus]|nr:hypothetical protein HMI55_002036 [Coelomomyces lativittatus]